MQRTEEVHRRIRIARDEQRRVRCRPRCGHHESIVRHRLIEFEVGPEDLVLDDARVIEPNPPGLHPGHAGLAEEIRIQTLVPTARGLEAEPQDGEIVLGHREGRRLPRGIGDAHHMHRSALDRIVREALLPEAGLQREADHTEPEIFGPLPVGLGWRLRAVQGVGTLPVEGDEAHALALMPGFDAYLAVSGVRSAFLRRIHPPHLVAFVPLRALRRVEDRMTSHQQRARVDPGLTARRGLRLRDDLAGRERSCITAIGCSRAGRHPQRQHDHRGELRHALAPHPPSSLCSTEPVSGQDTAGRGYNGVWKCPHPISGSPSVRSS